MHDAVNHTRFTMHLLVGKSSASGFLYPKLRKYSAFAVVLLVLLLQWRVRNYMKGRKHERYG